MFQFKELIRKVQAQGEPRTWRNGHKGLGVFDARAEFDMRLGFPLLGLKSVPYYKGVLGELLGFLRGYDNAAQFRELGCQVWNQNANEEPAWLANPNRLGEDDLGRIYGVQWRDTKDLRIIAADNLYNPNRSKDYYEKGFEHQGSCGPHHLVIQRRVDQLAQLIEGLKKDPHGRRHVVSAWNPAELDQMALPPCHMFFQCYVGEGGFLDLKMYQRSADLFLGVPFNIASYATLLIILAAITGYEPRRLIMDFGDLHIYDNHLEHCAELLRRPQPQMPALTTTVSLGQPVETIEPAQFTLIGYNPHPPIKAEMAV